jgi:serine phosphatase RsbU (regulator of sigma subunit)
VLDAIATRRFPEWAALKADARASIKMDVVGGLGAFPFAVIGLVWLIAATDAAVWRDNWPLLLAMTLFTLLLDQRLSFTVLLSKDNIGPSASSSLSPVIVGSMMFLFGPSALWMALPSVFADLVAQQRQSTDPTLRASAARNFVQSFGINTLAPLCGLAVFQALGGTFPIADLNAVTLARAAAALSVEFVVFLLISLAFIVYLLRVVAPLSGIRNGRALIGNLLAFVALGRVMAFFGVLGSVLYVRVGLGSYVFAAIAIIAAAFVANRFTRALTNAAIREKTFQQLETLGRAIMGAPADSAHLPGIVQAEARGLFPTCRFEAVLFPDALLGRDPDDDSWPRVPDAVWDKLRQARAAFAEPGLIADSDRSLRREALVAPITDAENGAVIGGLYVMRRVDRGPINDVLPTAQAFAEQIASAVLRARAHEQQEAKLRAERELVVAGEIQSRFLPKVLPQAPGFQIAAHLDPARQSSGDFYDVVALPAGQVGITIADVADKGTGAALFMALACTLVRTYAPQHARHPDAALREVNRRICEDTQTDLFVTMLHGVLDPMAGEFRYANAGHTPGLLLRASGDWVTLPNGAMPLGILDVIDLTGDVVTLCGGDVLVLYTDGITDAQNAAEELFGDARLREVIRQSAHLDAEGIQRALLDAAQTWAGGAPQFDDIALIVIKRVASTGG